MGRKSLGNTTVRVLHAISTGVRYGFDVMDATGLPSGTVYPALSRLENLAYVSTHWEDPAVAQREKRPPRKYYTITDSGKHALLEATRRIKALDEMLASHVHEPKTSGR
jgi:DNA-binding PadR family transcriptional regulator